MVIYTGKEFKKINEPSKFYKILNKDLRTKEDIQLAYGLNSFKAYTETSTKYGLKFVTTPLAFMEGEYVLDFLGAHDSLEDPTVFEVSLPDDATVFVEDAYGCSGNDNDGDFTNEYYPVKYITDKLIINYRLTDSDFLYLFKEEGWIHDYHMKQEDAICRFFVQSGFLDTLRYVKSGTAFYSSFPSSGNGESQRVKKSIIYRWNVSVSQEVARTGNLQLLEEICSVDVYGKDEVCRIDLFAIQAFKMRRRDAAVVGVGRGDEDERGERLIRFLIDKQATALKEGQV